MNKASADAAGLIPEIWAQDGLALLRPKLGICRRISKDTKFTDAFNIGDVLNIPVPGTFNAPRKAEGTAVAIQAPRGMSNVQVTLDTFRATDFVIPDFTAAQANPKLREKLMSQAVAAIARAIEQDCASAVMLAAASNSTGTAGTALTAAVVRGTQAAFSDRLINDDGRSLAITPTTQSSMLGDAELRGYFNQISPEAVRKGDLGMVYGFDTFSSQVLPVTAVQVLNFVGGANGQTFRLVWNGFETADIVFDTTAATLIANINTALRAMTDPITMSSGTVTASGSVITAISITFAGAALRYNSTVRFSVEGVSGTAYAGTCAVTTSGTITENNLAFHEDAAIFCPRRFVDIPQGAGIVMAQVTDDDPVVGTGITLRVMGQYDIANRQYRMGLDVLYGVRDLRAAAAQRVLA